MAIDFPNSPTVGELFTAGDITREWNGTTWSIVPTRIQGTTGASFTTAISAKGDIVVGTGNKQANAVTIGSNYQLLISDASTATGVRWGDDFAIMVLMEVF